MTKKILKDSETEKISAGYDWKKLNRAFDYISAGTEAIAGIAIFSLMIDSNRDKYKNFNFKEFVNSIKLTGPSCLIPLALTAHGAWRIISRAGDFYDN